MVSYQEYSLFPYFSIFYFLNFSMNLILTNVDLSSTHLSKFFKVRYIACDSQQSQINLGSESQFIPIAWLVHLLLSSSTQTYFPSTCDFMRYSWVDRYGVTCGFVRSRLSVAIGRATNRCIRGPGFPHHTWATRFLIGKTGRHLNCIGCGDNYRSGGETYDGKSMMAWAPKIGVWEGQEGGWFIWNGWWE